MAHGWKPVGGYIQREGHTASRKPLTASRESDTLIIARKSRGLLGTRVETPPAEGTLWQEAANIQSFILSAAFLYRMPKPYFHTLADVAAPYLLRLPDGETGIRKDLDPLPPGRARRKSSDRMRHGGSAIQVRTMGR